MHLRPSLKSPSLRTALLALLLLALTVGAPATLASAATGAKPPAPKPTVVLVHGAWADGSSWNAVVSRLQHDGYPVRVPPNPLRGVVNDSTTLANFLATVPGPVILVGHSYGGAVITNAATGNRNVKALVYVDAFAPAEGEKIFPLAGADSAVAVDPTTIFDFVPYPGAPEGDVDLYLKHDFYVNTFAAGVKKSVAELGYAAQRPLAYSAGDTASGVPAYTTIPSWYLLGTQDTIITPAAQLAMAQRAHSKIVRVRAGHLSLIVRPDAVEKLVQEAARATR